MEGLCTLPCPLKTNAEVEERRGNFEPTSSKKPPWVVVLGCPSLGAYVEGRHLWETPS